MANAAPANRPPAQPSGVQIISVDELKTGQRGEVWTVFRGTEPEPFTVEVTGVVRNALGPGKSLILCQLTDPRVQSMGAVAGMSGSPLYVDGKLAGALSYQIQRFETVRYAGFTPAADLIEVQTKMAAAADSSAAPVAPSVANTTSDGFRPLRPVFTLSGLSPVVADLFAPKLAALGLSATSLGGSTQTASLNSQPSTLNSSPLTPGSAVAVALATGDITLAGTGTVSNVEGNAITAFGHPMLSLGEVALPMCAAEIVTILPSNMQSVKVANTGAVIGTITQDRLSAVSGRLGEGPEMTDVEVTVSSRTAPSKTLKFSVARQEQLTPVLVATGVTQAILGSNDAGLSKGFLLRSDVMFPAKPTLASRTLYSGPQGFQQGLTEFVQDLAQSLQNPYEKTFPKRVVFNVEALDENPAVTLELFQLSRSAARAGEVVQATLAWRDFQGEARRQTVDIPIDPSWTGRDLEVVLAPGRVLDEMSGRPRVLQAAQLRSFDAYLAALRDSRAADGLCLAVVEKTRLFTDQTSGTPDAPASIERIARAADEARFNHVDALVPLWESHVLHGKLSSATLRRSLKVDE
ncbi:SpoIVB peptidase S55 domain-containing protein [Opitutus terrae]|uniref:SpoIVB peptidase S55 domain-containing protein n=1 Tax=Opitutus terrae TaxID=107709 RepID=UPI00030C859B|nr:SpoIVB peptidase S55 domain-containing protein [Opitutus terrae]